MPDAIRAWSGKDGFSARAAGLEQTPAFFEENP
jgi:hypothetical protein